MEFERDVTYCVSQVPNYEYTCCMCRAGNGGNVEELTGVKLNAREEEKGCSAPVKGNERKDLGGRYEW